MTPADAATTTEPTTTRLVLPYPVSVNDIYKPIIRGRGRASLILTPQARAYRQRIAEAMLLQRSRRHRDERIGSTWHGSDPVAVAITVTPPDDHKKHDLDNTLKALLDGLKHAAVFDDDDQIVELHVRRLPPSGDEGRVTVVITSLEHVA